MYTGKAKVFELLWNNDDDPNVQNKLMFNKQEANKAKIEASSQVRSSSVTGKDWIKGIREKQRRRTRIFEI